VISNGQIDKAILNIIDGQKIGTFFTNTPTQSLPVDVQAMKGIYFYFEFKMFVRIVFSSGWKSNFTKIID
jgi:hypothetical protein